MCAWERIRITSYNVCYTKLLRSCSNISRDFIEGDLFGLALERHGPRTHADVDAEVAHHRLRHLCQAAARREGSVWKDGKVTTPKGFKEAYRQYVEGGWAGLPLPAEWGGQGLPKLVATAVAEMLASSNLSFSLCPLLTRNNFV